MGIDGSTKLYLVVFSCAKLYKVVFKVVFIPVIFFGHKNIITLHRNREIKLLVAVHFYLCILAHWLAP